MVDIEAAKKYTPENYYALLIEAGFAGVISTSICPEVVHSMKPVVKSTDYPYSDTNGNHLIRLVEDSEGNIAYFDATHMDILNVIHPGLEWHLAISQYEVLVAYQSPSNLLTLCPCNIDPENLPG